MQVLIPRTGKVSMALYTSVFVFLFFSNLHAEKHPFPFPKIIFHCVDWVKDTLPSYDLDFVRNNPRCIGNPTVFASPKTAAESPQVLPNASWQSRGWPMQPGAYNSKPGQHPQFRFCVCQCGGC